MKKVLLDTNAYTRLLTGDEKVLDTIADAATVYMSVFVLGELFALFSGGSREKENREILNRFLMKPTVKILNATAETAEVFGMVKNNLKNAGTPIPKKILKHFELPLTMDYGPLTPAGRSGYQK